jgi:hypothetical protein
MDIFHRKSAGSDTRTGRDCCFCSQADPEFSQRFPMDRLVGPKSDDTANAHLTEDGYVKHRLMELRRLRTRMSVAPLAKSA